MTLSESDEAAPEWEEWLREGDERFKKLEPWASTGRNARSLMDMGEVRRGTIFFLKDGGGSYPTRHLDAIGSALGLMPV